jgi:concanavalin A-like lectin/glucanase superfamily protein
MKRTIAALGPLVFLVGLAVPHACSQMCTPPPKDMVSWWTGDGTTLDYFGRNDGLTTPAVSYAAGEVADAFSFGGTEYVQVPQSATLEPATLTIDAWVNAAASPGLFRYIVSKGGLGDTGGSYALYTGASGGLQFYIFDGTLIHFSQDAGGGVWDGSWHHVAGSFDGAALHLFVDGVEAGSAVPAATTIAYGLSGGDVTNDLFIGNYNPNCTGCLLGPYAFTGEIDEVELFQRALSSAEISAISAAGRAGKCLPVEIDTKLHSFHDYWDWHSEDNLTVAVLGSAAFDAAGIVRSTLLLSKPDDRRRPKAPRHCHLKDVNGDAFPDLVCHFQIEQQHRHDDDDDTIVVTGQVQVPGGQRTFFGKDHLDLKPERHPYGEK